MASLFIIGTGLSTLAAVGLLFRPADRPTVSLPRVGGRHFGARRPFHGRRSLPQREEPAFPSVSVVVPTLNEADSLAWVLEQLPPWVSEVVLVDGLSTDHTEAVARQVRSDLIVVHQSQRGKGAALRAGFAAATSDIVVMLDADGSTNPAEMDRFVAALQGGADFVKGSRQLGGSEDWTLIRRAGNRGFVELVNLIYGSDFTDLCYGYCAFWRRSLGALALTADGFEIETQLVLNAVKAGLKIQEVASLELPRRAGASNLNAFRDGCRVLKTIMAERPGSDSRQAARSAAINLERVTLPTPGRAGWMPAGSDRRRNADRRRADGSDSIEVGRERRGPDRRKPPHSTVTVYRVVEPPVEVEVEVEVAVGTEVGVDVEVAA